MAYTIGVLHAAIAADDNGVEGLVAFRTDQGAWVPLVASGEERLAHIRELAIQIGEERRMLIHIKRFDAGTTIETLDFRAMAEPGKA